MPQPLHPEVAANVAILARRSMDTTPVAMTSLQAHKHYTVASPYQLLLQHRRSAHFALDSAAMGLAPAQRQEVLQEPLHKN